MSIRLGRLSAIAAVMALLASGIGYAEDSVTVANGKVAMNSTLQFWMFGDGNGTGTGFKIRRAEFRFSGSIADNSRWFAMFDPSRTTAIRDLGVAYTLMNGLELVGGQFKIQGAA